MTVTSRVTVPPVLVEDLVEEEQHVLLWQVCGESTVTTGDTPHHLAPGLAVWVPATTQHSIATGENSVVLPMFFTATEQTNALRSPTSMSVDHELRTLFLAYVQSTYTIIRPSTDLARQILAKIGDRPPGLPALRMPTSESAAIVARALRADAADHRGTAALARSAHASTRTIERAFRAETGMTLRRWRIENRIAAAAALLRSTSASVDVVAGRVGYSDTSAFRRAFKASTGMSPGEYAARFHHDA